MILFAEVRPNGLNENRGVEYAASLCTWKNEQKASLDTLVRENGLRISPAIEKVLGITAEECRMNGKPIKDIVRQVATLLRMADVFVMHGATRQMAIVANDVASSGGRSIRFPLRYCTAEKLRYYTALPGENKYPNVYAMPTLRELYHAVYGVGLPMPNRAKDAVFALRQCFFDLWKAGIVRSNHFPVWSPSSAMAVVG
jgi:DNA polymerase III epsilon subunit-like protein